MKEITKSEKKYPIFRLIQNTSILRTQLFQLRNSWRKSHEIVMDHLERMVVVLNQNGEIYLELTTEAIQRTAECQKKLEEFEKAVLAFNNSKNSNISELIERCLMLYDLPKNFTHTLLS